MKISADHLKRYQQIARLLWKYGRSDLVRQMNAAAAIPDPAKRDAALDAARRSAEGGHKRVFVGKDADRSASVRLSDAEGQTRLKLTVDADGNPRIEFLDAKGQVVQRLPAKK